MLIAMLPFFSHGQQHLRLMGLNTLDVPKAECMGSDVYCNTLAEPDYKDLAEGGDGKFRAYHLHDAYHPHEEPWNIWGEQVDPWLDQVGRGIY
eukprot:CAMPEP_0172172100 /NCGR_PEP_ID=MMETSP1050-20130122/12257_1 /TAXON_ID=233186 /ORGANISM="Cryptomonas curvata, Strain CCAP979/52" /LENGTH=92 /DNA_ID=CAMNT_0012843599 /DNA_START=25 /DNA_END=303 /DNA_ORIENTATION=+